MSMKALLEQFESESPEIVFEWNDPETEAVGWIVLNSLRGGAAGGGTRMRKGLDKHEVISLAKTMEIKFSVVGPPIGGAKSGINFDPSDARKEGVLRRWFQAVMPLLKTYYGTGGDLNVNEATEVSKITRAYGLEHPQEGVLVGHFRPGKEEKEQKIRQLQEGVAKKITSKDYTPDVSKGFTVSELITGYGVAQSVFHYCDLYESPLEGKKVIVQGWGNVSASAAYYLALNGARIVGIIDRNGGVIKEQGLDIEQVRKLFLNKQNNQLHPDDTDLNFQEVNDRIWDLKADVLIPGAASRLLNTDQLTRLKKGGLEVISCGANVPFADEDIFYGPTSEYADQNFAIIPDFIANSGMARTFAYLMQSDIALTDEAIFQDVSNVIRNAIKAIHEANPEGKELMKTAYNNALKQVVKE